MNLDFSNPFFGFRNTLNMMYTICKRWLHFISESILAVFTFRKYLSSFLLGFPFHGMFWVILYAHEMCGGDDSFRILTLDFLPVQILNIYLLFQIPCYYNWSTFCLSFSLVCGQKKELEVVWQLNLNDRQIW